MVRQESVSLREMSRRETKLIMYYIYVLKSFKNSDMYVGSTSDLGKRVSLDNQGRIKSTKGHKPWKLLEYQIYNSRSEAVQMERFYKTGQQKELLRGKYGLVAKW